MDAVSENHIHLCPLDGLQGRPSRHTKAKHTTNLPRSTSSLLSLSYPAPSPGRADSRTLTRQQLLVDTLPAPEATPRLSFPPHVGRWTEAGLARPCHMLLDPYHTWAHWPPSLHSRGGRRPTPHAPNTSQNCSPGPTSNFRGVLCSEHSLPARATETLMIWKESFPPNPRGLNAINRLTSKTISWSLLEDSRHPVHWSENWWSKGKKVHTQSTLERHSFKLWGSKEYCIYYTQHTKHRYGFQSTAGD